MADHFHHDNDDDELAVLSVEDGEDAGEEFVVIDRDKRGLPCFGCYFGALFEAFEPHMLANISLGDLEGVPPEVAEFSRRFGATLSHVADALAAIVADTSRGDTDYVLGVFVKRLQHSAVMQRATEPSGPLN